MNLYIWTDCTGIDQFPVFAEDQTAAEGFLHAYLRTEFGKRAGTQIFKLCRDQVAYSLVVRDVKPGVVSFYDSE